MHFRRLGETVVRCTSVGNEMAHNLTQVLPQDLRIPTSHGIASLRHHRIIASPCRPRSRRRRNRTIGTQEAAAAIGQPLRRRSPGTRVSNAALLRRAELHQLLHVSASSQATHFVRADRGDDCQVQRRHGRRNRTRSHQQPTPIIDGNPLPRGPHGGPVAVRHGCRRVVGNRSNRNEQDAGDQQPMLPRDLFRPACHVLLLTTTSYTAAQHAWRRHTRYGIRAQPSNLERSRGRPRPILRGRVRLFSPTLR